MTETDRDMLEDIMISGVYGTWDNKVKKRLTMFGYSKIRYVWERFIEPVNKKSWNYKILAKEFPFFYRHKILLQILMVYRVVLRMKSGKLKTEIKAIKNAKV